MKKLTLTLILVFLLNSMNAQETKQDFKPTGKPFLTIFTNYHSTEFIAGLEFELAKELKVTPKFSIMETS